MLGRLTRVALRKGVIDGSKPWLVVGVAALGLRLVRHAAVGRPARVWRHELVPGETLRITSRRVR